MHHTHPLRTDIEGLPLLASNMGDRVRELFRARSATASAATDVRPPLVALARQLLPQPPGCRPGRQQDAVMCLMRILECAGQGGVRRRVCGACAATSVEGMVHCCAAEEAQVGRGAPPVSMAAMPQASLAGEQALREASEAVVLRVENTYAQDGHIFAVDVRADWRGAVFPVSVLDGGAAPYEVAAFVQHRGTSGAPALQRMRGGHCVAYANTSGRWFELDDDVVAELPEPPDVYPHLVFLARVRPRRSIRMGGKRRAPPWA